MRKYNFISLYVVCSRNHRRPPLLVKKPQLSLWALIRAIIGLENTQPQYTHLRNEIAYKMMNIILCNIP